jgi:hypothetical protein
VCETRPRASAAHLRDRLKRAEVPRPKLVTEGVERRVDFRDYWTHGVLDVDRDERCCGQRQGARRVSRAKIGGPQVRFRVSGRHNIRRAHVSATPDRQVASHEPTGRDNEVRSATSQALRSMSTTVATKSAADIGRPYRNPWAYSHPSARTSSFWRAVSTPSAVTANPSE